MDELTIDGKTYISSKRAAAITGYAKDYVGQLCREGRIEARLIGRSWYVYEPSIRKHRFSNEENEPATEIVNENTSELSEKSNVEAVWEAPVYTAEEAAVLPVVEETKEIPPVESEEVSPKEVTKEEVAEAKSEMENMWQDWFSEEKTGNEIESARESKEVEEDSITTRHEVLNEEGAIPVKIIKDIEPIVIEKKDQKVLEGRIVKERVKRRQDNRSKANIGNNLVIKAGLIALMVICAAVAIIGSGIAEDIAGVRPANWGIFEFLVGASSIK